MYLLNVFDTNIILTSADPDAVHGKYRMADALSFQTPLWCWLDVYPFFVGQMDPHIPAACISARALSTPASISKI